MRRRLLSQRGGDYPEVYGQYPIGVSVIHEYNNAPQRLTISLKLTSELTDKSGNRIVSDAMTTSSSKMSPNKCSTTYYISGDSVTNALLKKYVKGLWNADTETYPKSDSYINDAFDVYQFNKFTYTDFSSSQPLYTGRGLLNSTFMTDTEYSDFLYVFNFKKYIKGGKVLDGPYNSEFVEYDDSDYDFVSTFYTPFFAYQHSDNRSSVTDAIEDTHSSTNSSWNKNLSADGGSVNVFVFACGKNVTISNITTYNVTLSESKIIASNNYSNSNMKITFPANTMINSRTVAVINFTCDGKDYYLSFTQDGVKPQRMLIGRWYSNVYGINSDATNADTVFREYVHRINNGIYLSDGVMSSANKESIHNGYITINPPADKELEKWTLRIYYTFNNHFKAVTHGNVNFDNYYDGLCFYLNPGSDGYHGNLSGGGNVSGVIGTCYIGMVLGVGGLTYDLNPKWDGVEQYVTVSGYGYNTIDITMGYYCENITDNGSPGISVEFSLNFDDGTQDILSLIPYLL